mgnify:CR=1 FL=1
MGNHQSAPDLVDTSLVNNDFTFKVDNINSYGRKHSSAKIQVSPENLCIHQKHRQSLFIPLDTIKRYGLDGSIFILECGRRAPLGQARYAFRCKQARRLVDCLDQRITTVSNQLLEQQQDVSSLSLTNVSSTLHNLRRTQSAMSLSSATSFYRNSEPDLSENYFAFGKENDQQSTIPEMNYAEFKVESPANLETVSSSSATIPTGKSYVYIDHEKTTTLKEIAKERLQNHPRRFDT